MTTITVVAIAAKNPVPIPIPMTAADVAIAASQTIPMTTIIMEANHILDMEALLATVRNRLDMASTPRDMVALPDTARSRAIDLASMDLASMDLASMDLAGMDLAGMDLAGMDLAGMDPLDMARSLAGTVKNLVDMEVVMSMENPVVVNTAMVRRRRRRRRRKVRSDAIITRFCGVEIL